jgi:hypothetical protein
MESGRKRQQLILKGFAGVPSLRSWLQVSELDLLGKKHKNNSSSANTDIVPPDSE